MSTNYPNQDKMSVGIVVGGDSEDPASDQAGGFRVHLPEYGPNVPHTDLPFARKLGTGSEDSVISFSPPPERGTAVMVMRPSGRSTSGDVVVIGTLTNEIAKGGSTPGNSNLGQLFQDAVDHVTDKKSAAKSLKKADRDGAEIREVVDDKMWSHSLAKGLPSALGLKPLSGIHLDQMKNISTAIQSFTSIPSLSMLGSLPGMNMSLGSMLSMLSSSGALDRIKSALPNSDAITAFESMSNLITSNETSSGSAYGTSSRVNPEVYLANAEEMLSKCRDIGDLMHCFNELQSNTQLFGLDTLDDITVEIDTPFGTLEITIDFDGNANQTIDIDQLVTLAGANATSNTANANVSNAITRTISSQPKKSTQDAMKSILSLAGMLQSASQAFSVSGENFFGKSAVRHFDMMQRLNPGSGKTEKQLMEVLHQGPKEVQHLREVTKLVRDGGKIFSRGFK